MTLALQNLHGWNSASKTLWPQILRTILFCYIILVMNQLMLTILDFRSAWRRHCQIRLNCSCIDNRNMRIFFFSVYVCMCTPMCTWCKHVGVPAWVCACGDQKTMLGVFFDYSPPYCLRQGLSLALSSQNGFTSSRITCFCLPISSTGVTGTLYNTWLFMWVLRIWTQVRRLAKGPKGRITHWTVFSNLDYTFWKSEHCLG